MVERELDRAETRNHSASQVSEPDDEPSVELVNFFHGLWKARRTILEFTAVCLVIAMALAFLLPTRYTSTATFIPPATSSGNSMAAIVAGQLSSLGAGDLLGGIKNSGDLYAGILGSRSIERQLVKKFELMKVYRVSKESEAEKTLKANTSVTPDPKSSIVTLAVTDKNPQRAQDLADAYMEQLRSTNGRLALSQSSQRRLFFEQQLVKEKNDLEEAELDLKKSQEQSGLIAPTGQAEAEIRTITELQAQVAVRQVQLAALRQSATDQNPGVVRLQSEIGDLQGQLSRMQTGKGRTSISAIPTSKVPALQLDYVRKAREVKYHEALFEMLSRQYEAARLDEAREAPVLQVLDSASYPDTRSSPKRLLIILGGLGFGLLAGCGWVLIRDHLQEMRGALAGSEPV